MTGRGRRLGGRFAECLRDDAGALTVAAGLNRARYVVETYDGAPSVAKALDLMAQAYAKLGMKDLATDTREILDQNYPGSSFPQYGEARARPFFFF